jgi:predicted regulator of Ras-like GTPase activity (Roadblock/LC7/MglB family)
MSAFREVLRRIAERVEGTRAVAILGLDAIPVETHGDPEGLSIEAIAAELVALVKASRNPRRELETGPIREVCVVGERSRAVLSRITPEYYLLLLLGEEGSLGRVRYELERASLALEKEMI